MSHHLRAPISTDSSPIMPTTEFTSASERMEPLPENFAPVFFCNQFRTTIEPPTLDNCPSAKEQCAIVTGANSGLGLETAKQLLSLGLSHLIMAVRSMEAGKRGASTLRQCFTSAKIDVWKLEMASYESIQYFAKKCESLQRIDIALLNAGLAPGEFRICPETGHEEGTQVNYLSTMLLAVLMLPTLKAKSAMSGSPPRLTTVSSARVYLSSFPNRNERPLINSFDDTSITTWNAAERYNSSKLLCQLFLVRLAKKVNADDVIINMVDPGLTKTALGKNAKGIAAVATKAAHAIAGRPVEVGAATFTDTVLRQGKQSHGCFLMNCKISP